MALQYSFTIEQNSTFDVTLEYLDSNLNPIDLTNHEAKMQLRPSQTSNIVIATLNSNLNSDGTGLNLTPISNSIVLPKSSGSIGIYISAATSSLFNFESAVYDLLIYSGSVNNRYVERILEGRFKLIKGVTKI